MTTDADNTDPFEWRDYISYHYPHDHGKARCEIICPFCECSTIAYRWSLSGSGKKCSDPKCGAVHGSFGQSRRRWQMNSNRFQFVKREHIHGSIGGIDWGYNLSCIMRSPTRALFWSGGSAYWSGMLGNAYGESGLSCYWRPSEATIKRYGPGYRTGTGEGSYIDIGTRGGRLDRVPLFQRVTEADWEKLAAFIGEDLEKEICRAIDWNQTVIVEGGGEPFRAREPRRSFRI